MQCILIFYWFVFRAKFIIVEIYKCYSLGMQKKSSAIKKLKKADFDQSRSCAAWNHRYFFGSSLPFPQTHVVLQTRFTGSVSIQNGSEAANRDSKFKNRCKINCSINDVASFVKLYYDLFVNDVNNSFLAVFCIWNHIDCVSLSFWLFLPEACTPRQCILDLQKMCFLHHVCCVVIAFKSVHKLLNCYHMKRFCRITREH